MTGVIASFARDIPSTLGISTNSRVTFGGTDKGAEPIRDCLGEEVEKHGETVGIEKAGRRNSGTRLGRVGARRSCLHIFFDASALILNVDVVLLLVDLHLFSSQAEAQLARVSRDHLQVTT